jgi:hypothetical protein
MGGFEVDAEAFKRYCTNRGVSLSTIKEAFVDCKPRNLSPAVVAQHAFAAKRYGWEKE